MKKYALVIKPKNGKLRFYNVEYDSGNKLEQCYREMECDTIAMNPYVQYIPGIEYVTDKPYEVDCWIDDNGKLKPNTPTMICTKDGEIIDVVMGAMLVDKGDYRDGESYGMTEEEIEVFKSLLRFTFVQDKNGKINQVILVDL